MPMHLAFSNAVEAIKSVAGVDLAIAMRDAAVSVIGGDEVGAQQKVEETQQALESLPKGTQEQVKTQMEVALAVEGGAGDAAAGGGDGAVAQERSFGEVISEFFGGVLTSFGLSEEMVDKLLGAFGIERPEREAAAAAETQAAQAIDGQTAEIPQNLEQTAQQEQQLEQQRAQEQEAQRAKEREEQQREERGEGGMDFGALVAGMGLPPVFVEVIESFIKSMEGATHQDMGPTMAALGSPDVSIQPSDTPSTGISSGGLQLAG